MAERGEVRIGELLRAGAERYEVSLGVLESIYRQVIDKGWDKVALEKVFGEKVVSAYTKIMGKGNTYSDLRAAITDAECTIPEYYQPSGSKGGRINGVISK